MRLLLIEDDEPSPTATSSSPTATPVFVDIYEPNNTIGTAYETSVGTKLCAATLWPVGDIDWYRFVLKKNRPYQIETSDLSSGLATILAVYNPSGNLIATNDDYQFGSLASRVIMTAGGDGFYYAKIQNKSTSDPARKTHCFQVTEARDGQEAIEVLQRAQVHMALLDFHMPRLSGLENQISNTGY